MPDTEYFYEGLKWPKKLIGGIQSSHHQVYNEFNQIQFPERLAFPMIINKP